MGRPLSTEEMNGNVISICNSAFPLNAKGQIESEDGHSFVVVLNPPVNHDIDVDIFVHCPSGADSQINLKHAYWELSQCKWINEDLLFVRVWWGRHWGSDYIYNADTQKVVYAEGFSKPRVPAK